MLCRILSVILCVTFVAAFSMYADTAQAQYVKNGLVSYWSFDTGDIDGNTVKDLIGNHDGTIKGEPKIIKGKIGDALDFDGVDDHVDFGKIDVTGFTEITESAWVSYRVTDKRWLSINHHGGDDISIAVYDSKVHFHFDDGNAVWFRSGDIAQNTWYHVALTFDGTKVSGYVDGALVESRDAAYDFAGSDGATTVGKHAGAARFIDGSVDEVLIYNRALSADEVKQNFAAEGSAAIDPTDNLPLSWGKIKASR